MSASARRLWPPPALDPVTASPPVLELVSVRLSPRPAESEVAPARDKPCPVPAERNWLETSEDADKLLPLLPLPFLLRLLGSPLSLDSDGEAGGRPSPSC